MAARPPGRGPSPREDASRRQRGWEDEPRTTGRKARRAEPEDAPWLDEGDFDDEGPTHTLVGRRTLWGMLALLAILTIGVIVGIMLVTKRESTPIDVPAVGEEVPVLANPGPWKVPPSGPGIDGVPVEGQGQVLFGTGDGRDTEARIALDALPEDPLPRPGSELAETAPETIEEATDRPPVTPAAPAPKVIPPVPQPKAAAPAKSVTEVTPKAVPETSGITQPKAITPSQPKASGGGNVMQLGAFSSEARARQAFKSLTERYRYLADLEAIIIPVATDGKTLYRLRSAAGSSAQAREICGRLKVAGEACTVL